MRKIFVLQAFAYELEPIYVLMRSAAHAVSKDIEIFRVDELSGSGTIVDAIYESIENADLIICDLSQSRPNVMYELGYAHGLHKPVIIVAQNTMFFPFDVRGARALIYDMDRGHTEFIQQLSFLIKDALDNPDDFSNRPVTQPSVNSVFVSYSHQDVEFLRRLMVHLKPLEKERIIESWVDTKLQAGDQWKKEIEEALNRARVAILLVTADFLASDFIVDNELPPILAKAESQGTRIIPVILKPCRFVRDRNLSRFQAINNPQLPIINLSVGEQEKVYDSISEAVERSMIE